MILFMVYAPEHTNNAGLPKTCIETHEDEYDYIIRFDGLYCSNITPGRRWRTTNVYKFYDSSTISDLIMPIARRIRLPAAGDIISVTPFAPADFIIIEDF